MACSSGKLLYPTKQHAKKHLARARGLRRDGLHPYRCRECGWWHLGHRTKGFYQRAA